MLLGRLNIRELVAFPKTASASDLMTGAPDEVPAAMRDEVAAALPGSAARTRRGTPSLDLRAGLHRQLAALGVAGIGTDPRCTMEDPQLYSHRRDGRTGRQAAVTWLDPRSGPAPGPGPS